jgi:hypothetical protein
LVFDVDYAEADGSELAQDAGHFAGFATQVPLVGEAGADPVGEESNARMVDETFGLPMEHGADLEVALEFAKGFFNFAKVFVVALDLRGICPCDGEIGVGEIPGVMGGLGGELGEGSLGFGDEEFTAFPGAVFALWTSADDMALSVGSISMRRWASVSSSWVSLGRSLRRASRGEAADEFETFVETAEIEVGVEFDGLGLESGFTGKVGGGELANFGRDLGDMADGAGGGHAGLSFSEAWF